MKLWRHGTGEAVEVRKRSCKTTEYGEEERVARLVTLTKLRLVRPAS